MIQKPTGSPVRAVNMNIIQQKYASSVANLQQEMHHPEAGDRGDGLRAIDTRGRLPILYRGPGQYRALDLRLGTHPLCQMDTCPLA